MLSGSYFENHWIREHSRVSMAERLNADQDSHIVSGPELVFTPFHLTVVCKKNTQSASRLQLNNWNTPESVFEHSEVN